MTNQHVIRAVVSPGGSQTHNQVMKIDLVNADGSAAGTVKKAPAQANSTATTVADLVADHNALLAKLRTAGVIATS